MSPHNLGCRCDGCKAAKNSYEQWRRKTHAAGRVVLVDAEPVRQHIQALRDRGMGWQRIASIANVPWATVSYLLYGSPKRGLPPARNVNPMTAKRLLSVQFDLSAIPDGAVIDGTGTRRRLQALLAAGWTQRVIGQRLGVASSQVWTWLRKENHSAGTYRLVKALHDELWDQAPPQSTGNERKWFRLTQKRAAEAGFLPTAAWDDIDLDPEPVPAPEQADLVDEVAVQRAIHTGDGSHLTDAEKAEVVRVMVAKGASRNEAAQVVHWSFYRAGKVVAA